MLSYHIEKLLTTAREQNIPSSLRPRGDEQTIEVSQLASQAAVFYEKLRNAIDYKEEHLLRRNAMERMLKRKVALNINSSKIAYSLITEFIRAHYLPNNQIPERVAEDIQHIIDRYLLLNKAVNKKIHAIGISIYWKHIMSLAATEIERYLFAHNMEDESVKAFYHTVKDRLQIPDNGMNEQEREMQIYLACSRSLLHYDEAALYYGLFRTYYPDWHNMKAPETITAIAEHFVSIHENILKQLRHRLGWQLISKLKNEAIYFSLIKEIAETNGSAAHAIFSDPQMLKNEIVKHVQKKYSHERTRINRSSWRAVIYIFLTKIILAFVLELPYDLIILKEIGYLPLGINVIFHPILLFAVTRSIKSPSDNNTELIVLGINTIVYNHNLKVIRIRTRRYGSVFGIILVLLYLAMFIVTFGALIWFLNRFHFNIVSGMLFLFFLTLVSYFGLRIRYTAKNWYVRGDKESPLSFIWDIFTLPIIKVGRWLSKKFASINIFIFIMDFIIEAPFKLLLEVFEEFVSFVREKKDEIY